MSSQISETELQNHPVISNDKWIEAGAKLLVKEKELSHMRDQVAKLRRELPWVPVEQDYVFEGPDGKVKLSELFKGKNQLIIYHCMWGFDDDDGCPGCSLIMDHVDSARQHFEHHDIAFAAISHAPVSKFIAFKKKMGWTFPWLSSAENTFNYDFGVSYKREDLSKGPVLHNFTMQKLNGEEQPGLSAFFKNDRGEIFRTYSTYERGLDLLIGAYNYIDLTAEGRNESGPMDWVNFHDRYPD
jgi:predicted dithiol-disulfide oxidoreductase (DUF899 family)